MKNYFQALCMILFLFSGQLAYPADEGEKVLKRRVASVYMAESFINEQIKIYSAKSTMFRDLHLNMDAKTDRLYLTGRFQMPLEDLKTLSLDKELGDFKFQLAIRPRATKDGHLKLEFPIAETYFYLANSKNPERDKVVIPVQLLSLALASARGYLSSMSGDFSSFDRQMLKLKADLREVKKSISKEKNEDLKADLELQKQALQLKIAAVPIERAQAQRTSKKMANILSFMGDDVNLNNEITASENSLIFKLNLGRIVPYLKDIELAGIRVSHDSKDGDGEDYLVVGVDSVLAELPPPSKREPRKPREGTKIPPSMLMRINQAVFNSKTVVDAQKEKMGNSITDFDVSLKDDGVHVTGVWRKYFIKIPFDTTVDFVTTKPDVFEVRLRELTVRGIDLKFITRYALDIIKERLDKALAGICTFRYLGIDESDNHILEVTVEPKKLVPAFPDLHLVAVDVGNREFLFKVGHIEGEDNK